MDRSITVSGISYNTIKRYILDIEQDLEYGKYTFNWTIDKVTTRSLGSINLFSYKISFAGTSSLAGKAFKKFRQLIFRGGG